MPRLTFRLKLLLSFLLVIVGAVGASLVLVERRFREDIDARQTEARNRIQRTCDIAQSEQVQETKWGCRVVAEDARLRAIIENQEWDDVGNLQVQAEELWKGMRIPFLAFIGGKAGHPESMKCVATYIDGRPAGAAGGVVPAAERLGQEAFRLLDRARASLHVEQSGAAATTGSLLCDGALYRLVALPLLEDDKDPASRIVGAEVVGRRFDAGDLENIRQVVDPEASVALVVGDAVLLQVGRGAFPPSGVGGTVARVLDAGGSLESGGQDPSLLAAARIRDVQAEGDARPEAAVLVRISTAAEHRRLAEMSRMILTVGALSILVAALIALLLSGSISRPIVDLVAGAHRIGRGDYSVDLPVRSRDELGTLTSAFNEMAKGLADRERYRSVLTKVVSKEVAHELMSQMRGQGLDYEGVGRVCTALFCDIRGFTPLTERMEPRDVISMLNEHMTAMVRVIEHHKGVVNKFVGDAVIAIFGAPVAHGDDPLRAVCAGLDMMAEVRRVSAGRAAKGQKEVAIGIGIHTGPMVCGVMGSQERAEYTVLGAAVNLTARVCGGAKPMQVVVSGATFDLVKDQVDAVPLGEQTYKGFSERIPVFEVRALRGGVDVPNPAVDARARV